MSTPSQKVFTISELTHAIKSHLEPHFRGISVQGEVSNFKLQSSGHLYFSLKDKEAQISCVVFKGNTFSLTRMPKDGDQILAIGEISIYPPRGNYQLVIRQITFSGIGELLIALHALKEKLQGRGFFDLEHKKPLPKFPKTIGIVTSPTGAVIQDILHILEHRSSNAHVLLYPVKVQGEGAKEEIAQAIRDFSTYQLADVLIVARGGGSLEDLWAFNEEMVATAIFASKIPIISGVGHETDTTICDLVADHRAPTPSGAAVMVIGEREKYWKELSSYHREMCNQVRTRLLYYQNHLRTIAKQSFFSSSYAIVGKEMQKVDEIKEKFSLTLLHLLEQKRALFQSVAKQTRSLNPLLRLQMAQEKLKNAKESLTHSWKVLFQMKKKTFEMNNFSIGIFSSLLQRISLEKERLFSLRSLLHSLDPKELLKKGYCILFSEKESSIILSTKHLKKDQKILAQLSDGKVSATINEIMENK